HNRFSAWIAADQFEGEIAGLLQLRQHLTLADGRTQTPVQVKLVLGYAVVIGPFSAAADDDSRSSENLFELGPRRLRILVAINCQHEPLRNVLLAGAVLV